MANGKWQKAGEDRGAGVIGQGTEGKGQKQLLYHRLTRINTDQNNCPARVQAVEQLSLRRAAIAKTKDKALFRSVFIRVKPRLVFFAICHLPFAICHLPSVLCPLPSHTMSS